MAKQKPELNPLDAKLLAEAVMKAAAGSQDLLRAAMAGAQPAAPNVLDPLGVLPSFQAFTRQLLADPSVVMQAQLEAWRQTLEVWRHMSRRLTGVDLGPVVSPADGDRRFRDPQWTANPFFDFLKQSYLVAANSLMKVAQGAGDLDAKTAHKVEFYTRQFVDALAPTNFVMTNPEVIRATIESGGRNLLDGLRHLLEDIDPKDGRIRPKMVDASGFELGKNIANTPGSVVFQNEMMQLIQYAPATDEVYRRPLLIIPPWINKFYILDLQPKNSFIRWAVARGHTVFVISWVNPDESLRDKDFEDYVFQGPIAALDTIAQATGENDVNVIGYCLGGTLLGATLAYLRGQGDTRVQSATFFTALLDFSEPGDLGVFIDEQRITDLEQTMSARGYLDGREMADTFNMIRANDLIWSFVINNYLLGKEPTPFDLLYWNSDSTRMPACMHSTYLRQMYMENRLSRPGGISIRGVPLDLGHIDVPACYASTVEDHITPWRATYLGAQLLGGPVTFLLGKAGHVAGIINPPGPRQYGHYTGPAIDGLTADEWFAGSVASTESWWLEWDRWIAPHGGDRVPARIPGAGQLPVIEAAPGSYVRRR